MERTLIHPPAEEEDAENTQPNSQKPPMPVQEEVPEGEISVLYCKNIMRAIQNFHHQELVDTYRQGREVNKQLIGCLYPQGLLFKPSEIEFISKKYVILLQNRLEHIRRIKNTKFICHALKKQKYGTKKPYKPSLGNKSSILAIKKRESDNSVPLTTEERLIASKSKNQALKRQLTKKHQVEEVFSHRPNVDKVWTVQPGAKHKTWQQLHQLAKQKSKLYKIDVPEDETKLRDAGAKDTYTFKPNPEKERKQI